MPPPTNTINSLAFPTVQLCNRLSDQSSFCRSSLYLVFFSTCIIMAQTIETMSLDLKYTGLRYLMKGHPWSVIINYSYNGATFHVLASAGNKDHSPGYNFDRSIEGKILEKLSDLGCDDDTDERNQKMHQCHCELTRLAEDACLSLMRELGPGAPLPEPRTLQEGSTPRPTCCRSSPMMANLLVTSLTLMKSPSGTLPSRRPSSWKWVSTLLFPSSIRPRSY